MVGNAHSTQAYPPDANRQVTEGATPIMDTKELTLSVAVLAELRKRVCAAYDGAKVDFADQLEPGTKMTARSPLTGAKLGSVWVTDPDPAATVTDRTALDAWIAATYPEKTRETITDTAEALAVLREHAPELIGTEVPDWARAEVTRASDAAGAPVGPGGELDVPGVELRDKKPTVSQKAAAGAGDEIESLVRAGYIDPATGQLRAIEGVAA